MYNFIIIFFFSDSIFTARHPSEPALPLGNNLGDLESEIEPGCSIQSFVSAGAKFYSYKVNGPDGKLKKIVTKCRGITQNSGNSQLINYEKFMELVLEGCDPFHVEDPRKIMRTKDFNIVSKPQKKIVRSVNDKRIILPNSYISLPYGYISDNEEATDSE